MKPDLSPPLLQVLTRHRFNATQGYRVFPDGRHELMVASAPGKWTPMPPLQDQALEHLLGALRAANLNALPERHTQEPLPRDAPVQRWELCFDGNNLCFELTGRLSVPELHAIEQAYLSTQQPPPVSCDFELHPAAGNPSLLLLDRSPMVLPGLDQLMRTLLSRHNQGPARSPDPQAELLLTVHWREAGVLTGHHRLWSDGRLERQNLGAPAVLDWLHPQGMASALRQLAALDQAILTPYLRA